jgi:ketosteroid isomerase-like protein
MIVNDVEKKIQSTLPQRLVSAVNDHDLDALAECFAVDYRNETPAHPGRGFVGRSQVRENWARIFAGVPDITADVLRTSVDDGDDGDAIWSEWEMRGTRPDGAEHLMRGVIIFGVEGEQATWARFYLEPVDPGEGGVAAAIGHIVEPQRQ